MRRAALIGNPVEHSLSPFMHNAAFAALGIDATYELWQTAGDEVPEAVRRVREPGMLGANVTVPHKLRALEAAGSASTVARPTGAPNTLQFGDRGIHAAPTAPAPGRESRGRARDRARH